MARMDAECAVADLRRAHTAIAEATGQEPRLLRPPWGHVGGGTVLAAAELEYELVLWSMRMREAEFPDDPAGHAKAIVAEVRPGSIVLAHDVGDSNRLVALRGLPDMITQLRARGYEFVTVSELKRRASGVVLTGAAS
jgi:peptidoglycan/xylan/chitin deacetylase (PgdA/CDA1 family)